MDVNQDLDDAKQRGASTESQLSEQNRQLDAALSDRLELEAKVEAASDERRSLLERCLGAENEVERARSAQHRPILCFLFIHFKVVVSLRETNLPYTFIVYESCWKIVSFYNYR